MTLGGRLVVLSLMLGAVTVWAASPTLNLDAALRLAGAKSLAIQIARERTAEARSRLQQEQGLFLPWISPGLGYRRHDGNLQDVVGDVFDVSKQSGTAALALQSQVDLGEAYYRVLAAKQSVVASNAEAEIRRRETILAVAAAYTELCRTVASLSAAEEALRISRQTLTQVRDAAAAGLVFTGEAQRAEVQSGGAEAHELESRLAVRLASIRLAQLLRLPPEQPLHPVLDEFVPLVLVVTNQPLDTLVASALTRRPEMRRAQAMIAGARAQYDGAVKGPWLPTLGAQVGVGLLAGGQNNQFGNGDDFQDYWAGLSWRIGPGGIGDRARRRTTSSQVKIAEMEWEQTKESVTAELVELRSRAEFALEQVALTTRNLASARRLMDLTQARKEFGIGVVLEAIEAEREWTRTQTEQLNAVANHNLRQWEFWFATRQDDATSK
jgi:outer membrane protein TolC